MNDTCVYFFSFLRFVLIMPFFALGQSVGALFIILGVRSASSTRRANVPTVVPSSNNAKRSTQIAIGQLRK